MKMYSKKSVQIWLVTLCAFLLLSAGCSLPLLEAAPPDPTITALYQAVRSTVTAAALLGDESSSDLVLAQANALPQQALSLLG